ncbi:MAG: hypothetical protein IPP77_07750 [Bacteroidetes bacterium]|nr:hypothetical protein [Bacteroidota bacterium]
MVANDYLAIFVPYNKTLMMTRIQEIFCDSTSDRLPAQPLFTYKSTYHQSAYRDRVFVDFSLFVVDKPSLHLGIWRCRVNFWLPENTDISEELNNLQYYMTGFRRALAEAEKFVFSKYGLQQILAPQTDEQLTEKYETLESTRIARQQSGVVQRVARKFEP